MIKTSLGIAAILATLAFAAGCNPSRETMESTNMDTTKSDQSGGTVGMNEPAVEVTPTPGYESGADMSSASQGGSSS